MNAKTRILQQLTDEAQAVAKTTTIDLDAFLAVDGDERARRWRQFDRAAKWQLVAKMIERLGRDWSEAEIEHWIAKYDAKWETATAETDLTIPPAAEIMAIAAERAHIAYHHDDIAGAKQLDRVRMNIHNGARLTWHYGDLLVQSVNHPGQVYSVSRRGCTCPNGAAGKVQCWHQALFDLLTRKETPRWYPHPATPPARPPRACARPANSPSCSRSPAGSGDAGRPPAGATCRAANPATFAPNSRHFLSQLRSIL